MALSNFFFLIYIFLFVLAVFYLLHYQIHTVRRDMQRKELNYEKKGNDRKGKEGTYSPQIFIEEKKRPACVENGEKYVEGKKGEPK